MKKEQQQLNEIIPLKQLTVKQNYISINCA